MSVNIVKLCDILQLNGSISIDIKLVVSLSYHSLASFINYSTEGADELIKVYLTIPIAIEMIQYLLGLFFG